MHDVRVRPPDPPVPWDYAALVADLARDARSALDLGTGGGERLAMMRPLLPGRVYATEEWHVNAPIAHRRLRAVGVPVVQCSSLHLPFADATFDLITSRHEDFSTADVARMLTPGGVFVTQQVGHDDWRALGEWFPEMVEFGDHFLRYQQEFTALGMRVERAERHEYVAVYETLGDFVYMLLTAPWSLPDLDVERDIDRLLAMYDALGTAEGGVRVPEVRELTIARKPA
jgi:SAM-dependent methyltransferase